ncbi:hypothetical protein [Sporomusa malonica]|uniref:Uncharacterized protein n=1 Tax=Sporomusa malonica TaxID=112901 RepID=A0A1W2DYN3_9FIRM|nr:hypothetical protein [Sporomusa malonica]SMD02614.1 hypothetical protein SAMN04488500_11914 [Sporomusa malonica]
MNKIKFLYDVVKTLKGKDIFNGMVTAEVEKDQAKIFYVRNAFEKNLLTMQTTANITTEVDYAGKQVKHQSTTEITNPCACQGMHHKFFKHFHHAGSRCGGIKSKLAKLGFALSLLNNIQIEEHADKTSLVTLEITETPEDIKAHILEKMNHAKADPAEGQHCFLKEFCYLEKGNLSIAMSVNKEYEIKRVVVTFDGTQNNEQNEKHVLNIKAELQLN